MRQRSRRRARRPATPATVDLLGVLAYGELTAFERLATDARLAPTIADKAALASMAAAEFEHYRRLREHLRSGRRRPGGGDGAVRRCRWTPSTTRRAPNDWLEGLIKAYVGDGLATDFYREVAAPAGRADPRAGARGARRHRAGGVRRGPGARGDRRDPAVAGRLALWARRLVGEALIQAQRVAVERDALTELLVGRATWPASPGCSTGSPTTTRPGWRRWA